MNELDEIEKKHWEQYEANTEYKADFEAKQVERAKILEQREEQEQKSRNQFGRYTLNEAAKFIAENSASSYESILNKLMKSANTGEWFCRKI